MKLKLVAVVVCDHEERGYGCTETAEYTADPESVTLEEFGDAAKSFFRGKGWQCCSPAPNDKCLCPAHTFQMLPETREKGTCRECLAETMVVGDLCEDCSD